MDMGVQQLQMFSLIFPNSEFHPPPPSLSLIVVVVVSRLLLLIVGGGVSWVCAGYNLYLQDAWKSKGPGCYV